MIIRQKTKRRLFVLVAGVMLVGAAATTAFLVRRAQVHRDFMARREQGMSAFKRGEIVGAVANLTKYVARYPKDAEALFCLASARRQFPTPDGGHLHQTIHFLRQYLDLEPRNVPARRMMLEAYLELGYDSEAVEAANQLLAIVPDDRVGNRALIKGLQGKRDYKAAKDRAEKYTKSEPSDLELQVIMIELYDATGEKQKILPHAVDLLKQNPDDGRFELLLAVAYNMVDRWTGEDARVARELVLARDPKADVSGLDRARAARFLLEHAAKRAPSDAAYVHLAIRELDKIGLAGESLSLLQRWDAGQSDPEMRRLLVRRLWESNRFNDVDRALRAVDPASPLIEAELVGLRAVSLASIGQNEEAARLADVLTKRAPDPVAIAWASIVRSMHLAAEPDPSACVEPIHQGLDAVTRNDAYLRYYLAEAYTHLGEYPYAIELLRQVVGRTRGNWSMPLHRLSRLMLIAGESEVAIAAADMALRRSPGTVGHAVNLLHVAATRRDAEDAGQTRALLDLAKQVRQAFPDDQQTLPVYVLLLARSGQEDEARRTLQEALGVQNPPRQAVLLQLAAASIEAKLGLEEKCFEVAEAKHGINADLAFARAMELYQRGRGGDGMKRFEDHRARAQASADASWRLAHAKLLEVLGERSAAAPVWAALADDPALAGNLQVQRATLNSRFAQADRQLISRTIDRVRKLTGEQAVGWRVARALWLLQGEAAGSTKVGDGAGADPAQAVELLRNVVEVSLPNDAHSRVLYAMALERTGKLREAIEQMSKAAELRPASHMISLELARLYQADGKFELARQLIQDVAREQQRLTPQERRQLVVLLARQGSTTEALSALQSGAGEAVEAGGTVTDQVMLVELLRRQNRLPEADSLVRKLMAEQPTLHVVQVAAAYYASTRRDGEAERALASLDKLQISDGERHAARARHYHAAGKPDKAAEHYRAAAAAAPENLELTRGMVSSLLSSGRIADATRAAEQAAGKDAGLQRLVENAAVVETVAKDKRILPLVVAIVEEPEFAQASIDALRVVVESRDGKAAPAAVAAGLRPIADRAPRLLPLQRLLLNYHLAAGQGDAAVAVATRCMTAAPDSPELAQLVAEVFGAAGSWRKALSAGEDWRKLSLSDTLAADQFIAQSHLRLNDPSAALKQLQPHLAAAEAAPDSYAGVLLLRARALLMQGDLAKAGDSLWPHVARASGWRMAWLELTSALNAERAIESWLERLSPAIPDAAVAERLALANTWYVACDRIKSDALFRKAQSAMEQLAARPDASADVFFGLAVLHEVQKRLPEADVNYRKALRLNPQHAIAKNNLAMVITNSGGDLAEAMGFAREAVRAQPNVASLYDTLATIQHRSRDYRNAAANLRAAIGLEPEKLAWRLNLADVLIDSGDATSAGIVLRETEGIAAGMKDVPADERQRLQSLRGKLSSAKGSNQAATTEP